MVHKVTMLAIIRAASFSAALAGFMLATFLAASPVLHELAHEKSGDGEHHCLATVLHAGACDAAASEPLQAVTLFVPLDVPACDRAHVTSSLFLSCRILEHAPPSLS
jgi:Na+/H+ antiporter NhaC